MMKKSKLRNYTELSKLKTFKERYEYLKLDGIVGKETFGADRYLNQLFYNSPEWRSVRNRVIVRDDGCDLGIKGHDIYTRTHRSKRYSYNKEYDELQGLEPKEIAVKGNIIIHHMNPISITDLKDNYDLILNPEYLICTCYRTHNAIHFGNESLLGIKVEEPIIRKEGDTKLW